MQVLSRQRGVSLIEVMMAVLIFSIGLIGLAGLMVMATRSNHSAYLRTQVTFLANNMADRMSANSAAVWTGGYNNNAYPVSSASAGCGVGAGCSPADLATHDQKLWSGQLTAFLPNPSATINCSGVGAVGYDPTSQLAMRPPYGGTCTMTIKWSEQQAGDKNNRGSAQQEFDWKFQP
ncbi:MAG: type IV pilus modification protein PilV [Rhodanobacter sp.]